METGEITDIGTAVIVAASEEVGSIVGVVLQAPDETRKTNLNTKAIQRHKIGFGILSFSRLDHPGGYGHSLLASQQRDVFY
jgi:hypothetical protein